MSGKACALEDTRRLRWKWGDKTHQVVEFSHHSGQNLLANAHMGRMVAFQRGDGTMVDLNAWKALESESESESEHSSDMVQGNVA